MIKKKHKKKKIEKSKYNEIYKKITLTEYPGYFKGKRNRKQRNITARCENVVKGKTD